MQLKSLRKTLREARLVGRMTGALWPHARPYPGMIWGIVGFGLLALVLRSAGPWPLKWLFEGLTGEPTPFGLGSGLMAAAFVILTLGAAGVEALQRLAVYSLANKASAGFRLQLFGHLMALPITFHHRRSPGELLTRAVSDTARIRRGIAAIFLRIVQSIGLFVVVMGVLFWIDPLLASGVMAAGLLALGTMTLGARSILRAARRNRRREGQLATVVEENLQSIRETQTFRPGQIDPRFEAANARSLKGEQKLRRLEASMLFRVEVLLTLALGVAVAVGTWRIETGVLTAGDLVLFLTYLLNLHRPLTQSAQQSAQLGRTAACADRLLSILAREPLTDRPGAIEPSSVSGAVEFDKVGVKADKRRRGSRETVLEQVSFRVEPGQRVAVVGPNGSGKSSLLVLLARLADPTEGRILLDGVDLREYRLSWLRQQFRVVYQDPLLLGSTLREFLTPEAIVQAQLDGLVAGLRKGVDTRVRRGGKIFSVGERQRVSVARALGTEGGLWLLDEPATALDASGRAALTEALLGATTGRTTLWVTHDASLISRLDRVLVMETGRVAFFGAPAELEEWLKGQDRNGDFFQAIRQEVEDASGHPRRG